MRENWFEKGLRSKVSKENHELDLDSVWDDIQAKRSDKDRRKPFFWRWTLIGLLLVGFSLAYVVVSNQETKPHRLNNDLVNETKVSSLQVSDLNQNKNLETSNKGKENLNLIEVANDKTTNVLNANSIPAATKPLNSSSIANSEKSIIKREQRNSSKKTNSMQDLNLASNNVSKTNDPSNNSSQLELTKEGLTKPSILFANNLNDLQDSPSNIERLSKEVLEISNINVSGIHQFDLAERELNLVPAWEVPKRFKKVSIKNAQMLTLGFSYGLNSDVLAADIDSGTVTNIISRRNMVETKLDYFSTNLSYKRFLSSSLFLNLGLGYEQYTSRFEYEDYTFTSGTKVDTTEIIIYSDGSMDFFSEEVPFVTTEINKNTNFLKYRSITLPVGLGLSINLNDNFNIELEAGVAYHLRLLNKGNVLNSALGSEELKPLDELYKNSNHWSSYTGFSICRYLGDDWKVGLGMRANFDLTNRAMGDSNFSHKMKSYTGQISLTRIF